MTKVKPRREADHGLNCPHHDRIWTWRTWPSPLPGGVRAPGCGSEAAVLRGDAGDLCAGSLRRLLA